MSHKVPPIATLLILLLWICIFLPDYSLQQTESPQYYSNDVFVKDLKLFVEGKEFFVKGVAYNPVPLGILNMTVAGYEGTGYCSPKKTVYGEYKSACFGSDYFDGVIDKGRFPPGPQTAAGVDRPWWSEIWERDFKNMKELGINTIRIYNLNIFTKTLFSMYPNEYVGIVDKTMAAVHIPFLDAAHQHGFKVIVPIVTDQTFLQTSTDTRINKHIEASVTELGDHPALLMWCLGNEMGIATNETLLNLVNQKLKVVRERTKAIHNRVIPVTHAVIDLPDHYEHWAMTLDVDVFTTNAGYRDTKMDPLWNGEVYRKPDGEYETVPGWKMLSQLTGRPLLIGEMGMHQKGDEITKREPDWFNQQYAQVVGHVKDGCIGTVFFEYLDEVNKPEEQKTMGIYRPEVTVRNGDSSMEMHNFIPDTLVKKEYIYEAIAQGLTGNFSKYNFNADVFQLLGRKQVTESVIERNPPAQPSPAPSPTSPSPSPPSANPSPATSNSPASSDSNNNPQASHTHDPKQSSNHNNGIATAVSMLVLASCIIIGFLIVY